MPQVAANVGIESPKVQLNEVALQHGSGDTPAGLSQDAWARPAPAFAVLQQAAPCSGTLIQQVGRVQPAAAPVRTGDPAECGEREGSGRGVHDGASDNVWLRADLVRQVGDGW